MGQRRVRAISLGAPRIQHSLRHNEQTKIRRLVDAIMSRIFVCGDTHFPHDVAKLNTRNFPEQKNLSEEDVVIILGDFGLLWGDAPDKEEIWWTQNMTQRRFTTLFLDGNHENHHRLGELEQCQKFGGPVGIVNEKIFHLRRGNIYTIGDVRLFVMGGAASTDKEHRVAHETWWPEEIPSAQEEQHALDAVARSGGSVDYVLTHTCPARIAQDVSNEALKIYGASTSSASKVDDPTTQFLDKVEQSLDFKEWHFGHFHLDAVFDEKYFCHYQEPPQQLA